MKEVTYEEWQKNPTPRVMWVWNSNVDDKVQAKVIYVTKLDEYSVVTVTDDDVDLIRYKHCAEIEKQRRMTKNKEKYKEIFRLKDMLEKAKIPFNFSELFGGYHIMYPVDKFKICSVIEHDTSYGREQDLLEIKGLLTKNEKKYDDVIGYLSAEDVFQRIKNNWKKLRRCLND